MRPGAPGRFFFGRKLRLSQLLQRTRKRLYPLPGVARAGVAIQLHKQHIASVELHLAVVVGTCNGYGARPGSRTARQQSGNSRQASGCQPTTMAPDAH